MASQCDYAQCPGRDEPCLVLQAQGVVPPITLRFHQSCAPLALQKTQGAQAQHN